VQAHSNTATNAGAIRERFELVEEVPTNRLEGANDERQADEQPNHASMRYCVEAEAAVRASARPTHIACARTGAYGTGRGWS
jgi:hypothetical protein